jgi:hypothetical protein
LWISSILWMNAFIIVYILLYHLVWNCTARDTTRHCSPLLKAHRTCIAAFRTHVFRGSSTTRELRAAVNGACQNFETDNGSTAHNFLHTHNTRRRRDTSPFGAGAFCTFDVTSNSHAFASSPSARDTWWELRCHECDSVIVSFLVGRVYRQNSLQRLRQSFLLCS